MPIELLYHDADCPGGVSPFDAALVRIVRTGSVRLACPYIGLGYLHRVIGQSHAWWLLTDIEEWLRSQDHEQRERVYDLLVQNRDRVRHLPGLHAKVAVGPRTAMLGSANFTTAGIRRRTEVSVLIRDEPQVQELADWFDTQWRRAYELDDELLDRVTAFMATLPAVPVAEHPPDPEIAPPLSTRAAGLVPLAVAAPGRRNGSQNVDFYHTFGHEEGWREWDDARRYGFICAGGGPWYSGPLARLNPGNRVWVFAPRHGSVGRGYVGVARVTGRVQPAADFRVRTADGRRRPVMDVVAATEGYHHDKIGDPENCEYFVPVRWLQTVSVEAAVWESGFFATELIVCQPTAQRWHDTRRRLRRAFPDYRK